MDLGANLKKARTDAGYTQKGLADRMQVSQKDISRWENNERMPNVISLGKFCKAVGISADTILEIKI
jgi:transcriptional regulator with XRE-family HTH domain